MIVLDIVATTLDSVCLRGIMPQMCCVQIGNERNSYCHYLEPCTRVGSVGAQGIFHECTRGGRETDIACHARALPDRILLREAIGRGRVQADS